jgi:hypothetical protein
MADEVVLTVPIDGSGKAKPTKALPTDRLSFEKQMDILRAYAAASGPSKASVGNAEVAKVANISPQSVSLCNGFFVEAGLLIRDGYKQRPSDAVFDYLQAHEWSPDDAGRKLAAVLRETWFANALLPKLAFRPLSRGEAVTFLADESKASRDYQQQLDLLLDYLAVAGVVKIENNTVSKGSTSQIAKDPDPIHRDPDAAAPPPPPSPPASVDQFSIPIPGKAAATITVPKGLDADDWTMLEQMIKQYIERLRKLAQREEGNS